MIKYLLLCLLPFSLFASKILSYNIYDRTDRDDVMITFDTPYTGLIKQSISQSKIIIKLEDALIESSKIKRIDSKYLHSIYITPMKNQTQIIASISKGVKLLVSKTSDSYGLRLRFLIPSVSKETKKVAPIPLRPTNLSKLPTKKEIKISSNYYIVVTLLILAIIFLLIFKKKIQTPLNSKKKESWLFKSNTQENMMQKETQQKNQMQQTQSNISIRFQKSINETNSVIMLDFGAQSYLVLIGNSNILLEKFNDNKPSSKEEFENVLQSRHEELERFLGNNEPLEQSTKEPLQAYKERAASLIYSDEI